MNHQKLNAFGNPVDSWWNTIRPEIGICIDMLGQFPPARNSSVAREVLPAIHHAQNYIQNTDFPVQAAKVRDYLLESLQELAHSVKDQATHGLLAQNTSHNVAYHNFMMVSHLLLQRGIYEPAPGKHNKARAS